MSHSGAGGKQPVRSSKQYDSYLLRYQDMKHMQESKNQPKNQQNMQRQEPDSGATYETYAEMPQIEEELSDEKASKKKGCKTKLCVLL
ncbi:unnamed protein product [Knipowitschia caucasica]|uniref:Uncharacterized protein n=1 Tax=Knipowitschia caucasica TaxID=637954 RepID=A0AAV2MN20_KNICA